MSTAGRFEANARIARLMMPGALNWPVQNHGILWGYTYFHHLGMDRNMRDIFRATNTTRAPRNVVP